MMRFVAAFCIAVLAVAGAANAKLEMTSGIRYVEPTEPLATCNTKAQDALNTYLSNVGETTPSSGVWTGNGPKGTSDDTSSAVVRCVPYQNGYAVMFTCAIQTPPNPYTATITIRPKSSRWAWTEASPTKTASPETGRSTA
jgi:hypothetical protein